MNTASLETPPRFDRQTAAQVLEYYPNLADLPFQWETINQGQANDAARIVINNKAYLLKSLPREADPQRQEFATAVLQTLTRSGFPCPELQLNCDGNGLTRHEGQLFILQTWLDGHHLPDDLRLNPPDDLARELGGIVGRLHATLDDTILPTAPENARVSVRHQVEALDGFLVKMFQGRIWNPAPIWKIRLKPGKTVFDESVISSLLLMRKVAAHLKKWLPTQENTLSRLAPVHGDLNWENILMTPRSGCVLIDFDNTQLQPHACEIAAALAVLCPHPGSSRTEFLEGYSAQGMPVPSRETLLNLMLLKYSRSLAWQISNWYLLKNRKPEMRKWIIFLGENLRETWSSLLTEG